MTESAEPRLIDPELVHAARHDPVLAYMIKKGMPLTRKRWMSMNYAGAPPDPWTSEDEAMVPEPWRRGMDKD